MQSRFLTCSFDFDNHADKEELETFRNDELMPSNRSTVLRKPATDFTFAIKLFHELVLKPEKEAKERKEQKAGSGDDSRHNNSNQPAKKAKIGDYISNLSGPHDKSKPIPPSTGPPIIIVPNSRTGVISSLNIIDFLYHSTYIPIEQKIAEGGKRMIDQIIKRPFNTANIPLIQSSIQSPPSSSSNNNIHILEFKVVDNASHLSPVEWERVVAVFALGEEWQFKGWKYDRPAELFQHVLGVHVALDDKAPEDKVSRTIATWNIRLLKVNKSKRHLDAGAVNEFWGHLEDFMRLRKPHILAAEVQRIEKKKEGTR